MAERGSQVDREKALDMALSALEDLGTIGLVALAIFVPLLGVLLVLVAFRIARGWRRRKPSAILAP